MNTTRELLCLHDKCVRPAELRIKLALHFLKGFKVTAKSKLRKSLFHSLFFVRKKLIACIKSDASLFLFRRN
jgi:hypothetical protein